MIRQAWLLFFMFVLMNSCSGGVGFSDYSTSRVVNLAVLVSGVTGFTFEGVSPFDVDALVIVQVGSGETKQDDITTVEVDFGNGAGWEDVTAAWMSKQDLSIYILEDAAQPHTYIEPGEYSVHCRVTFKDGEVFISPTPGFPEYIVTVTAPTE